MYPKTSQIVWVDQPDELARLIDTISRQPIIAVDTESDSLYSYFEKVCLVQISIPTVDYLVDPLRLDISALGAVFADPAVEKVFHAAEYDILSLKRDYGFSFTNLFDTMLAARILGWKKYGLGALLAEHFGVQLNKRFQRYNWGQRPLSEAALDYARLDTHYLLPLREIQVRALQQARRLREAQEAFERQTLVEPSAKHFDPDDYWRVKGARDLDPHQLAVLKELYVLRDTLARELDRPPFKIMTDATLVHLAKTQPASFRNLTTVKGLSNRIVSRYGRQILAAVRQGQAAPPLQIPSPNHRHPYDHATLSRYELLRRWRNQLAARRGVEPDVIISNHSLMDIARHNPPSLKALSRLGILGEWQYETYGETLLRVLKSGTS